MLTEEKIKSNAAKYFSSCEKYGFVNDDLIKLLGVEFIKAPATTSNSMHNAFEGGLIDHLLKVTKYSVSLNGILPKELQVELSSLVKVCLLHQIGKANLFVVNTSEWHKTNQGLMYNYKDDLVSLKVGERSVYYAVSCGIKLTEEEYQAILNYDKQFDAQAKYHTNTLGVLLKQANELAIMEEKLNNGK